ncbi:MAG: tetratricopeptide repeat protein [Acidobacteriota bacterium]
MKMCRGVVVLVFACLVKGQTAREIAEALEKDLHTPMEEPFLGIRLMYPIELGNAIVTALSIPTIAPAEDLGAPVSVAQLRHKVPKSARKAFERASQLSGKGDYRGAALELEKAIAEDPKYMEAYCNLGAQYFRLGMMERAAVEASMAIELDPKSSIAHANLAAIQLVLSRTGTR